MATAGTGTQELSLETEWVIRPDPCRGRTILCQTYNAEPLVDGRIIPEIWGRAQGFCRFAPPIILTLIVASTAPIDSPAFQTAQSAKLASELEPASRKTAQGKRLFYKLPLKRSWMAQLNERTTMTRLH
jgi:hypothetical protein